jgi:hypothetical protein
MNLIAKIAAVALTAAAASPACAASFVGSFDVTLNTSDPGLVLTTAKSAPSVDFDLTNAGDTASVKLFDLFTTETTVNGDDKVAKPISVTFDFTAPDAFNGSVAGTTKGQDILFGVVQDGEVTWNNPQVFDFGKGGELEVSLNDATFNTGFFGLNPGEKAGAEITADFTLLQAPSGVPEPAVWAMMLTGFGAVGSAMRSRRKATATA